MIEVFKKLYFLLTPKDRKKSLLLMGQMCASSLINIFGIALIFPFMTLAVEPDLLFKQKSVMLLFLYKLLNYNNIHDFLVFVGSMVFIFLIIGNVMLALTLWVSTRFALFRNYTLSKKLLECYLSQPYSFFLESNSSTLIKNVLVEVNDLVQYVLLGLVRLFDQSIAVLAILLMLLVINPILSIVIFISFGGVYASIYLLVRRNIFVISKRLLQTRNAMFKVTNEGFGGIKDIKFLHRENRVVENFSKDAYEYARSASNASIIGQVPRYALEIVAFGGVILTLLYSLLKNRPISTIIPMLSLYVFAGYRLMPGLQQIFTYFTQIKAHQEALTVIYNDTKRLPFIACSNKETGSLLFSKELLLDNVTFSYHKSSKPAINKLKLRIKSNSTVGFVGLTGAGKTTLIDIILGLLEPTSGSMIVDGQIINGKLIQVWQNNISYVPQHIYLCDDSILNNIAFGLGSSEINMENVRKAAAMASIDGFVEKELPNGYQTLVGERGVRLSGGQIQRIGIARALYRDTSLLVLDEATSSLDGITEEVVLDAIRKVKNKKTVIMVAHRFSTIKACDEIFYIKNGAIFDVGTFDELFDRSIEFRKMALRK
ncbi:MAG: ABC transporter ATP-binding protein [Gammaproteobacteria bacterium]